MAKPVLIVGNRNYSSWSLRPYMALAMAGIPFDQKLARFDTPESVKKLKRLSKSGLVPVLVHNDLQIWDTLAILEYAAETWPQKNLWPKNKAARAFARSISAEMHSGFQALRNACPMNLRRTPKPVAMTDDILKNVKRIESIWRECRSLYGKGGPFLFGKFSNADAMFAPVVSRFETYSIAVSKDSKSYMQAVVTSQAFQDWKTLALKEPWIVPHDEVD